MYSEDSIVIRAELPRVFAVAEQIEKYGDFIPSYKGVKILERGENSMTLERTARIMGKEWRWVSKAQIKKNEAILFDQVSGVLKGMHTEWRLQAVPEGTKVVISHDFSSNLPLLGCLLEKLVYNLAIKDIANTVLVNMKQHLEAKTNA